jgi:hypothetical protein
MVKEGLMMASIGFLKAWESSDKANGAIRVASGLSGLV